MIASQGFEFGPTWSFEANCTFFFELLSFNEGPDTESRPWWCSWDELVSLSSSNKSPDTKPRSWWCSGNKWTLSWSTVRHDSFSYQFNFNAVNFNMFFSISTCFLYTRISFLYPVFPGDGAIERACWASLAHLGIQVISKRLLHTGVPPVGSLGRWLVRDQLESLK